MGGGEGLFGSWFVSKACKHAVYRGSVATTFKGILGLEGTDQELQTDNWTDKHRYGLGLWIYTIYDNIVCVVLTMCELTLLNVTQFAKKTNKKYSLCDEDYYNTVRMALQYNSTWKQKIFLLWVFVFNIYKMI